MLTQTSVTAVRLLVHLGRRTPDELVSLRIIAEGLAVSPTYLAKTARHLVRAGILRAHHGTTGGVALNRAPKEITLLAVVEACQGAILGNFCQQTDDLMKVCGFHRAGAELHQVIHGVLSRWTLTDLVAAPCPGPALRGKVACLLEGARPGQLLARQRRR